MFLRFFGLFGTRTFYANKCRASPWVWASFYMWGTPYQWSQVAKKRGSPRFRPLKLGGRDIFTTYSMNFFKKASSSSNFWAIFLAFIPIFRPSYCINPLTRYTRVLWAKKNEKKILNHFRSLTAVHLQRFLNIFQRFPTSFNIFPTSCNIFPMSCNVFPTSATFSQCLPTFSQRLATFFLRLQHFLNIFQRFLNFFQRFPNVLQHFPNVLQCFPNVL